MRNLTIWQKKASAVLDKCLTYKPEGFRYEEQPDGVYFATEGNFVWFLKDARILTADPAGAKRRQTEGLHKLITENAGFRVNHVQKGIRSAMQNCLHKLTTFNGYEIFVKAKYVNMLPKAAQMYVDPKKKSVVAGLWDGKDLELIAGFPIYAVE